MVFFMKSWRVYKAKSRLQTLILYILPSLMSSLQKVKGFELTQPSITNPTLSPIITYHN